MRKGDIWEICNNFLSTLDTLDITHPDTFETQPLVELLRTLNNTKELDEDI